MPRGSRLNRLKAPRSPRLPKLPALLESKLYKSGQTRGADDDEIYQNRVLRTNTVLIFYDTWTRHFTPEAARMFENGYIVLLSPTQYFDLLGNGAGLAAQGLTLGENGLVFYETRLDWLKHDPTTLGWQVAVRRVKPLGGQYVARIAATTASSGEGGVIRRGFTTTANKGAGIRVYEYAGAQTIADCRAQLEALFWLCRDAEDVAIKRGMTVEGIALRRVACITSCEERGLLDLPRLRGTRVLNSAGYAMCPLCLEELSGEGFVTRMKQAPGREVLDLTVTEINLFHIEELRVGIFNHQPYNLGWGHHHCNVVVKDAGIDPTLHWMSEVVERNRQAGYLIDENNGNGGI